MKNVPTQVARNEDFYPRPQIVNKIYRRLDSRSHIFLAAPRRVGKTSIMRHLEDSPRENYCFVYVMLEDVYDVEVFYYELMKALLESKLLSIWSRGSKKLKDARDTVVGRIRKLTVPIIGIELNEAGETSNQKEFDKLLTQLGKDDTQIVFMLDEFPQTLENIKAKHSATIAEQFLQKCRKQRQTCPPNIRFIYTGSIGLPHVVGGITSSNVINDLNTVEVPPLSPENAKDMATKILANYDVKYDSDMLDHLMQRLRWLIPFHIQLALQEVIDIYEESTESITRSDIDEVFKRLLHYRNNRYFLQYKERLEKAFLNETTFAQVTKLLNHISEHNFISTKKSKEILSEKISGEDYDRIMESLQFDGYIYWDEQKNTFHFTSELLRMWWNKFVLK